MSLRSRCCDAAVEEVVSPAVVCYTLKVENNGISREMFPDIDGEIAGYRCSDCLEYFTNEQGDITDVAELIAFLLKGE